MAVDFFPLFLSRRRTAEFRKFESSGNSFFFLLNFGDNDSSSQVVEIRLFRFERKRDSNVGLFILDVQSGANRFLSIPQSEKTGFGSNGASLA